MNWLFHISLNHYLGLSGALFVVGLSGLMLRRNIIVIYMCLEMMLSSAILALAAFSHFDPTLDPQIMVFFIITVAAAEVGVGLALIVAIFRLRPSTNVNRFTLLKF